MDYAVRQIENDVLVVLDENNISESLLQSEDSFSLSLRDIIRNRMEDAVKQVISRAPLQVLTSGTYLEFDEDAKEVMWNADGSGWVLLPDDYLRLVAFQMSDWDRAAYEPIMPFSEEYEMQKCKYAGVRGNIHNPVVALDVRNEGKVLEFFSCNSTEAYVTRACYIPYPKVETKHGHDFIKFPPRCYDSVVYTLAALVCITMGKDQHASVLNELSKSSMV